MGGHRKLILAHGTLLNIEARETEHLLLESAEILVGELTQEHLFRKTRITRIAVTVLHGSHTLVELITGDTQGITELQRVKATL